MKIAVLIPAYNEALTIGETIKGFYEALPDARIVVIDNNSSDRTTRVAKDVMGRLGCTGQVLFEGRQGKANAARRALLTIKADIYVMVDADTTYPAHQAHQLIQPILDGEADLVVGDRISGGQYRAQNSRRFHNLGNRLVCTLVNKLFRASLADIMSGYRAFSRNFARNYPILVEGFQLETDMTLHALSHRFRITEIPIEYQDRPAGSVSKLNTFKDGFRVLRIIAALFKNYRPLTFFNFSALLFMFAGLIVGLPVIEDWIRESYIYHVPSAILAASLEVIGIILFVVGLILDTILHHELMRYEYQIMNND